MNKAFLVLITSISLAFAPGLAAAKSATHSVKHRVAHTAAGKSKAKTASAARASHSSRLAKAGKTGQGVQKMAVAHHTKARAAAHVQKVSAVEDVRHLALQSAAAVVADQATGAVLFEKNAEAVVPIASISKLMTAMVSLDAKPNLIEPMVIGDEDVDTLKGTHSRLKVGTELTREEMLRLALMSSENRAASALSRYYPGGRPAFIAAMNRKCKELGLSDTRFSDPTGLTSANVSSARDLVKMVAAAHKYPLIREFSTTAEYEVALGNRTEMFRNTNPLVRARDSNDWEIGLSKTGYISEAGRCLVMQAWLNDKPTIIVLLDSIGKLSRVGDANRIKRWIESANLATRTRNS